MDWKESKWHCLQFWAQQHLGYTHWRLTGNHHWLRLPVWSNAVLVLLSFQSVAIINRQFSPPSPVAIIDCAAIDVSGGTAEEKHTTCHFLKKTKAGHGKCQANALICAFNQSEGSEAVV